MAKLAYAKSFRELIVYQKSRQLAQELFHLSKSFPKEEMYALTDQIRRSSRSIGAQIAEAWAKRRYEKHFTSKLTDSDGEQQETQHWIDVSSDCRYWDQETGTRLRQKCEEIGRLLGSMIDKSSLFCVEQDSVLKEQSPPYYTQRDYLNFFAATEVSDEN